ncbi:imelysin family protein [Streptomyces sp. NPDC057743]|uniref:imelysin family protein n=1 Tax=Streptomyces sp. NPDC057743 TaxID=3346236 RepID=UPI0036780742
MPRADLRRLRSPRVWAPGGALLIAGAVTAVALTTGAAPDGGTATADGLPHTTIEVAPGSCGRGWQHPRPGLQVFDLHNGSSQPAESYLRGAGGGPVFGEVEGIGPGTTRQLRVRLGPGAYAFSCLPDDASAVTGPTVRVAGPGRGGPAAAPITQHDLIGPALDYQKWVAGGLGTLVRQTAALRTAVAAGDPAAARAAWLPAHLTYERLGAAYGEFGDADKKINGTTAGLAGGVHDPAFAGFHRLEYGLWHGESATALRAPAAALADAVRALRDDWAQARMDPAALGLRAHEILENTAQFELTGRTDYGSGSNLATARANLDGTRAVLARLRPLLASRDPELPGLQAALDRTGRLLDGFHRGGRWTPLDGLSRPERQRTNAALGDLVERLAPVATLCDPRRTV